MPVTNRTSIHHTIGGPLIMSDRLQQVFASLYNMRILTGAQIKKYFKTPLTTLEPYCEDGYIEKEEYNGDVVYRLTSKGIRLLREEYDLFGFKKFHASDIKLKPFAYAHQLALNDFALRLKELFPDASYYDEKQMPKCNNYLMPDGLLVTDNCLFLLEMDMGTEDSKQIGRKWDEYRRFLNYPSDFYFGKRLVCLFILADSPRTDMRARTIMKSVDVYLLDLISANFNIYINSADALLDDIRLNFFSEGFRSCISALRTQHGFTVRRGIMQGFPAYIAKTDQNKRVIRDCGRLQEFLVDSLIENSAAGYKSIAYFAVTESKMKKDLGRRIPLIILVDSERWIANFFRKMNCEQNKNIFFTTADRLQNMSYPECLFQLKREGNEFAEYAVTSPDLNSFKRVRKILR